MARTVYRWREGDILVSSTQTDSAARASEQGRRVTATTVGGK